MTDELKLKNVLSLRSVAYMLCIVNFVKDRVKVNEKE